MKNVRKLSIAICLSLIGIAYAGNVTVKLGLESGTGAWSDTKNFNFSKVTYNCNTNMLSDVVNIKNYATPADLVASPDNTVATTNDGELISFKVSYYYEGSSYQAYTVPSGLHSSINLVIPTTWGSERNWGGNLPDFKSYCSLK